jgi:hypothetical protein
MSKAKKQETDSLYPRLLSIPDYIKADKKLKEIIESRVDNVHSTKRLSDRRG